MVEVDLDRQIRGDLERLLTEHLVLHGVHQVCEELLARRKVCLTFEEPRARLLRSRFQDLGRLPAELCWRVMFAYVEGSRNYLAYGPHSERATIPNFPDAEFLISPYTLMVLISSDWKVKNQKRINNCSHFSPKFPKLKT